MKLEIYRHLWGLTGEGGKYESMTDALAAVRRSRVAYAGVEHPILLVYDRPAFGELLQRNELDLIPMLMTFGHSVDDHLDSFRAQLEWVKELPHRIIVSHSGRDSFDTDDAIRFFGEALRIERDLGLTIAHETHRGRILYSPWPTRRLLDRFEDLKLNCDYSHWVVVAERLLDDESELLTACAARTIHVHARVGFEQGPQVNDPRAPEWKTHLEAHERVWDMIWAERERRGETLSTLTPEFGPPPYQPALPSTHGASADLEEICDFMAERQLERFRARGGRPS